MWLGFFLGLVLILVGLLILLGVLLVYRVLFAGPFHTDFNGHLVLVEFVVLAVGLEALSDDL